MLSLSPAVGVILASEATDMRRGHDGLFAAVRHFGLDPFSGHLFVVFFSKRRNRMKRLEKGLFKLLELVPGEEGQPAIRAP